MLLLDTIMVMIFLLGNYFLFKYLKTEFQITLTLNLKIMKKIIVVLITISLVVLVALGKISLIGAILLLFIGFIIYKAYKSVNALPNEEEILKDHRELYNEDEDTYPIDEFD